MTTERSMTRSLTRSSALGNGRRRRSPKATKRRRSDVYDFETLEEERDRLLDENARLRRVVDLARRSVKNIDAGYPQSLELDALRALLSERPADGEGK